MRRHRQATIAVLLLLTLACASAGTGDPLLVRAEDVLSDSLTIYSTAMDWHFRNSTRETPATYHAFERFRVEFQVAWHALDNATRAYRQDKAAGRAQLDAALKALTVLLAEIGPLLPRVGGQ